MTTIRIRLAGNKRETADIMRVKNQKPVKYSYASLVRLIFLIVVFMSLHTHAAPAAGGDEGVSLKVSNRPLSQVLKQISNITGYTFVYSKDYADSKVSVNIVDLDLDKALRKILGNFNFAILYEDEGNIRIMIYGEKNAAVSKTADNFSSGESSYVGSAAVEPEEPLTDDGDIEKNQSESTAAERSEEDQQEDMTDDKGNAEADMAGDKEAVEKDATEPEGNDSEKE
jgi:hypothetical protein